MAKTFYTSGTGSQQTLTGSQNEKVAVYQTLADAGADLANLEAGQIVATPDTGDENAQPVDSVTDGDMHAVTSNAVFDTYAIITASSTTLTGKPPISQDSVIKIMFTSAITGSDTSTAMSLSYNGTSYPVKVGKNGSLSNFVASEISSGVYRYLQAYTTLELAFDGTQFIIIGNPVVLSSTDYTIYADGNSIDKRTDVFNLTSSNFNPTITDIIIRVASGVYNRLDKTVTLNIDIYSRNNLIPPNNQQIFTIPLAKYRPNVTIESYAVLMNSSDITRWEACRIDANGNCYLGNWVFGVHPIKAFALSITYSVS